MSVKCLCDLTKARIVAKYKLGTYQQKELAIRFDTSERTINRVLIEAGLLTPMAQIKADAYNVMQVLKKHAIDASQLDKLLTPAKLNAKMYKDVTDYLYAAPREVITELFYTAMMNKALDAQLAQQAVTYQMEANADADLPF